MSDAPTTTPEKVTDPSTLTATAAIEFIAGDENKALRAYGAELSRKGGPRVTVTRHAAEVIGRATPADKLPQWVLSRATKDGAARYQIGGKNVALLREHGDASFIEEMGFDVRSTGVRKDFDKPAPLLTIADKFWDAAAKTTSVSELRDLASMAYMTECAADVAKNDLAGEAEGDTSD